MNINKVLTDKLAKNRWLDSSLQCYDVLYTVVRSFQVKKIVEIGTYEGCSALAMCQAVIDNKKIPQIWCIDSYWHDGKDISSHKIVCLDNLKKAGFSDFITLIHGESADELPILFQRIGIVDLCFIDGDHSKVVNDYAICRNNSNILMFHDVAYFKLEDFLYGLEKEGWRIMIFPTIYAEGDLHPVGIALAVKRLVWDRPWMRHVEGHMGPKGSWS